MKPEQTQRRRKIWTVVVLILLYLPIVSVILASLANTRYLRFPHSTWTLEPYRQALALDQTYDLQMTSLKIAVFVALLSVLVAVPGALAFARYDWSGRKLYQRLLLLPVFFPQSVLGLAALVTLSALGINLSWKTAVFTHAVWIVPIVTLIVSIRVYGLDRAQEEAAFDLGASRLQAFLRITLPQILPGLSSGVLFAFLLSWSNMPLSAYTTGVDTTLPEWLYSRMATNYAPMVPAVSVLSIIASVIFVLVWQGGRVVFTRMAAKVAGRDLD
jgi:spermidine/putrescine transport system permease protein